MSTIRKQFLRQSKELNLKILGDRKTLVMEGPQGTFYYPLTKDFSFSKTSKKLWLTGLALPVKKKAFFGLSQVLLAQACLGVLLGYRKQLNILGIGYQVAVELKNDLTFLSFKLGLSHALFIEVPPYLHVSCPKPRILLIKGINLQKVNNFASLIRSLKFPNSYKEKGIYYSGEILKLKQGKKT